MLRVAGTFPPLTVTDSRVSDREPTPSRRRTPGPTLPRSLVLFAILVALGGVLLALVPVPVAAWSLWSPASRAAVPAPLPRPLSSTLGSAELNLGGGSGLVRPVGARAAVPPPPPAAAHARGSLVGGPWTAPWPPAAAPAAAGAAPAVAATAPAVADEAPAAPAADVAAAPAPAAANASAAPSPGRRAPRVLPADAGKFGPGETLVFFDDFASLDLETWAPTHSLSGFGNGEFQRYVSDNRTVLSARGGQLVIQPVVLPPEAVSAVGAVADFGGFTHATACTAAGDWGCLRYASSSHVLNPVASARVDTAGSFAFTYGRVEVRAALPAGDWLQPAVWLMPLRAVYGGWPASGEIDLVESRGNAPGYAWGGRDVVASTLHAAPWPAGDLWPSMHAAAVVPDAATAFHTYGLVWSEAGIFTYVDDPASVVLNTSFPVPGLADFFAASSVDNIYAGASPAAPFDQPFYMIINLSVGGTSYFPDPDAAKPWLNSEVDPAGSFYAARGAWGPTWAPGASSLRVDSVRVWQPTGSPGLSGGWLERGGGA